ncbi:helix-turn-helix-type transcriptional regulator [Echinicola strongylocentroti]|uniref:Helix-turn-helix-type transcriptional regulator n=1 Tax=Echinicola strongylocentroti TaxID=1795355 RepID=A0A2Z4IJ08_9BACT|nr:MerR family transcriptional regulator [Echinicola strongylocentroti]AWW30885.1 helix-turn-helix-type transcriptional regulator [Echinicola strongylocentroti]
MSSYSIKDLEHLSGIKAHTLRIWEQRYNLVQPKRTETNIRYYDDADLKLILNVALLNNNGFKISKIAQMNAQEMRDKVIGLTERTLAYEDQIHALTVSMIEIDEESFDRILSINQRRIGFDETMLQVIYPFLSKIGLLWQVGTITPAQEHFISNLIRQKLIVEIDKYVYQGGGKKFLLFLPEGELHEISLLFAAYLIKREGHKVIYLGQSTPKYDLIEVYQYHQPEFLITVITTSPDEESLQGYLDELAGIFADSELIVSGYQVLRTPVQLPENIRLLEKLEEIKGVMESLAANGAIIS